MVPAPVIRATALSILAALGAARIDPRPAQETRRGIAVVTKAGPRAGALSAELEGEAYDFGAYHALLIGIADYDVRHFPRLKTPVQDIRRLESVLVREYGFAHVRRLENEQATRSAVLNALREYARALAPEDNLLVYYAGHGVVQDGQGFWIPFGADGDDTTWISVDDVKTRIRGIKSRHTLLVSDSCFAGKLLRDAPRVVSAPKAIKELHRKCSCQVLTSGGLQPVADGGRDDCSLFAYHLAAHLEGAQEPFLTGGDLAHRVTAEVAGEGGSTQTPEFGAMPDGPHEFGEFVFVRVAATNARSVRDVAPSQEGVPRGWVLPVGVERRGGRFFSVGRDAAEMMLVPGGTFASATTGGETTVESFLIDRFEVTNERLARYLAANEAEARDFQFLNQENYSGADQPVVMVTLLQARRFAAWAGKEIPAEVQWEYAAGFDPERRVLRVFPWGDEFGAGGLAKCVFPPRVGAWPRDVSAFGVEGLGGGVREWCELAVAKEGSGAVRGGTQVLVPSRLRLDLPVADRRNAAAQELAVNLGFRCVLRLRRP